MDDFDEQSQSDEMPEELSRRFCVECGHVPERTLSSRRLCEECEGLTEHERLVRSAADGDSGEAGEAATCCKRCRRARHPLSKSGLCDECDEEYRLRFGEDGGDSMGAMMGRNE